MLSLASSAYSSLSVLRLFLPPNSFRADDCRPLGFRRNLRRSSLARPRLSVSVFSLGPSSPGRKQQFFDPEDEDEVEEDEEDDEDITAEEYVDGVLAAGDVSEDVYEYPESEGEVEVQPSTGSSSQYKDHQWKKVERLIAEVREFGEEIIDFDELAGVYDFPIDKFQIARVCTSEVLRSLNKAERLR